MSFGSMTNSAQQRTQQQQQTASAKPAADPSKPSLQQAWEHHEICKVRQVQDAFEQVRKRAQLQQISVEQQLSRDGYARFEDFILACKQFPLFCNRMEFAELGSGIVLYFDFLLYLIALSLLLFVFQIPIILEATSSQDRETTKTNLEKWTQEDEGAIDPAYYSPGNVGPAGWDGKWLVFLYAVMTLVAIVVTLLYQVRQRHVDVKCDLKSVHPNDFAIMVGGGSSFATP